MRRLVVTSILLAMVFGFAAFQCSSTGIVSAKLYIKQGHMEKAKEALLDEIAKNPTSSEAYYMLGYIYGEEQKMDSMLVNFDESLAIDKKFQKEIDDSKLYHWGKSFNAGVGYFNKSSKAATEDSASMFLNQCITSFENAILLQPDSTDSYTNLVYAYFNAGRENDAIKPLEQLIGINQDPTAYAMLGELYLTRGSAEQDSVKAYEINSKALALLQNGRKAHPNDKDILLLLSNAYIATDKIDVAKDAFKEGVMSEPENKYYRYNYGVLLLNDKEYAQAEEQFVKAIEIDPEYTNAIYNLGVTYFRWGVQMRQEAEAALTPGSDEEISDDYKEKLKLAIPHLEKYLEISPDEAPLWELMGRIYGNLGMDDKSTEAFKKADALK